MNKDFEQQIFEARAGFFFIGGLCGLILGGYAALSVLPDIPVDDVYRLCMVKNIPLAECKIPPKPYIGGLHE